MKNIRIGNDIKIEWSLYDGGSAFILEGRDVKVYLKDKYGRKEITDYVISGNMLTWTFHGKNQRRTGAYSLELVVNENENGMITTDACQFVNLVHCSCDVAGSDDNGVSTETIELRSQLSVGGSSGEGGGSYDDTAIWKAVNNKVDKVVGKGLSTNDYTNAEKSKLAGLKNYDDSGIKEELTKKADKSEIPTKMSQLEQDVEIGSSYDDTKLKEEIAETYATKEYVDEAVANAGGGGEGCECATPDWNASTGMEGYIKNRTHYKDAPIEENTYVESGLAWGDIREIYPFGHKYYKVTINGETQIIDFVDKDWPQYDFEKEEQNKFEYDLQFDNNVGLKVSFFENGGYERMIVVEYYPMDSAAPETIDVSITDYYVDFKQLDEKFIPDTIARKSELTELSAEIEKLPTKEYVDNAVANAGGGGGSSDDTMTRIVAGATPYICYRKIDGTIGFWDGYFVGTNHRQQTDIVEILFGGLGATPNASQFLNGWTNLEKIYPLMNGSGCTDLSFAFQNDAKLKDLSMLKVWDVSKVTTTNSCFVGCAPEILPIENWNVSKIADMSSMFNKYQGVDVDFSRWTNNVVTTLSGFMRESLFKKADLHNISTEKCTTFEGAMRGCANLQWLDIRGWSCVSATSLHAMFNGCAQLTTLVGDTSIEDVISQDIKVLDGYTATSTLAIKESSVPLNRASLRALINGLADMSETGATLPIGSANIAKLTSDDIAVATAKGWTIS